MSEVKIENLEKNQVRLSFVVPHDEVQPYLEEAAKRLGKQSSIPGFRPGKAPYDVIKNKVGEMKIYEEALETIVRKNFVEAITSNNIETVGSPKFDVEKLAPGNDIVFSAEVARMPGITRLTDFRKLKVKAKKIEVSDKEVDIALNDVRRMQTKEIRAKSSVACAGNDKIVISMVMKKEGVPIEGGQSPNHAIFLAEEYYVPGLKEKVVGMKEGEDKKFALPFPKNHVQKMLAGANIDFEITLKEIYHLDVPDIDDDFAKSLGQKNIAELKELVKVNIKKEKEGEEKFRQEKEMLEAVSKESRFEEIPDLLLNEEINKMIHELKHGVESQGADFDQYLKNLKKTVTDLKVDFTSQALTRIKVALIIREIADKETVKIAEKEIDEEIDRHAAQYEDEEMRKQIYTPEYRNYAKNMLRNKKVIELLRGVMVK